MTAYPKSLTLGVFPLLKPELPVLDLAFSFILKYGAKFINQILVSALTLLSLIVVLDITVCT